MRKFKTAAKNRTNYVYYTAEGEIIELKPGQDGVDETWIALLHSCDDEELDAERHEEYYCPVRFESYHDGDGDDAVDRNSYLEDDTGNPLQQIMISIAEEERSNRMNRLKFALSELTDKQKNTVIKKFYHKMSNVAIAAEEGVSETAIRNRLKKIYQALGKKIL